MIKFTKTLSIIIFKRLFEKHPFILFVPKLYINKQKYFLNNYIILQKYILLYSYNFKLSNFNSTNLLMFYYNNQLDCLFALKNYFNLIYGFKIYNTFFDSFFLNRYKNLFFLSRKTFFLSLQIIYYLVLKYLYSFLRIFNKG